MDMFKTSTTVKSAKKERMISISHKEYTAFLQWQKKICTEMKDVDEAIAVAKNEKMRGKLKLAESFSAILKTVRR
mgnify:CR=1 FL=1